MSKNTWCIYPFVHLATFTNGNVTPCCIAKAYKNVNLNNLTIEEAWNHAEVKELRKNLIEGKKVRNCVHCYNDEEHGVESHRILSNKMFEKEYGYSINSFLDENVDIKNLINLDLRLGNTCNLKCVMCRPNESHKWYEDIIELNKHKLPSVVSNDMNYKINYDRSEYNWINKKIFWDNIDSILPNVKEFIFGGGEPFMLKEVKTLLNKAIDLGIAKNLTIRFHTNGTFLTEKDFEIFKHFKRIQLMFSLDGVNQVNYFHRYPAEWQKIMHSIELNETYSSNIESYILCSLTSISAYYVDELYNYVNEQGWKKLPLTNIILGRVHYPIYLNPQTLDANRKKIITDKLQFIMSKYPSVSKVLQENLNWILGSNKEATVDDTISYIESLLQIRNLPVNMLSEFRKSHD